MLKIELEGIKEFNDWITAQAKGDKKKLNQNLAKAAEDTQGKAVKSISSGARSGAIYKRGSISHQASAAGQLPKSDTGTLVKNITVEKVSDGYTVGSRKDAPHGFWLEFGTSNMSPRPWLQPAFDYVVAKFKKDFGNGR